MSNVKIACAYKKLVPAKELKPYARNRNKHPKEQIERLAKLIEAHGLRHPIIVSTLSGEVIAGNGRLEALKLLKVKEIPVDYQEFPDANAEYAFSVSDNAVALWAELDISGINADIPDLGPFDIELLGIKNFEIEVADKEGLTDEDAIPEKVEPRTKLGDIYKLGNHRLMCGDSTSIDAVEALMDGEKADMVFTDPPYGVGVGTKRNVGGASNIAKRGDYTPIIGDETTQTAADAYNLCAGMGIETLIFWGGNHYCSALPGSSCWIVWDKQNTGDFADAELAWTNQRTAVRVFKHMWNGMIKASERGEARVHPTQKPIALAEWSFENYGQPKSVLDLFGGSGSTLIACEKTNRKCFMAELDPHYCSVIIERWCAFTGQMAYLINDDGTETSWEEIKRERSE